jgi:hypothetical protein
MIKLDASCFLINTHCSVSLKRFQIISQPEGYLLPVLQCGIRTERMARRLRRQGWQTSHLTHLPSLIF